MSNTDLRLFGKPESFVKRRMGVALAFDADVEVARERAKLAAGKVSPRQEQGMDVRPVWRTYWEPLTTPCLTNPNREEWAPVAV
ncbi:hypothetical protein AVAK2825_23175 [Acidovorax sp. SUPP2825]|nr:hypothetical protein AVAK2825_23175 [Acidovorax sp. SUPP2825]